jgi:hypothetical protein
MGNWGAFDGILEIQSSEFIEQIVKGRPEIAGSM